MYLSAGYMDVFIIIELNAFSEVKYLSLSPPPASREGTILM